MAKRAQGITAITVGGYKSIRDETTIEIRPLTILAGANSSGKSSIMQPMLIMKQTLDVSYDPPRPLLLDGPHVKFTKFEQIIPFDKCEEPHNISFGYEIENEASVTCHFKFLRSEDDKLGSIELDKVHVFDPVSARSESRSKRFTLSPQMRRDRIVKLLPKRLREVEKEMKEENKDYTHYIGWRVIPSRGFFFVEWYRKGDEERSLRLPIRFPLDPIPEVQSAIVRLIHLPGLRGNPERIYRATQAEAPIFSGPFQTYTASLIARWREVGSVRIDCVEKNLRQLDLTRWVEAAPVDNVSVELKVGRLPVSRGDVSRKDSVNIADVGFGVSQVLPVIVALIAAEPGQLVYIEQPELHLHPRAQVALAGVLADAAQRGVRVVIETHSSLLLQAVMTLIAEDKLDHEDVMLHWFRRDEEGNTQVDRVEFDKNGVSETDWPVDFADVRLTEQRRYLDAVAKRRMGLANDPS